MRRYVNYLIYVLRHKYEVAKAGFGVGAPLWQLLVHDWSKLLPGEFVAYAGSFFEADGSRRRGPATDAFRRFWNRHQKIHPHHWQYWVLVSDNAVMTALEMPDRYVREMVADWIGAGIVITGRNEARQWYDRTGRSALLHPRTRAQVEALLEVHG